jgi:cell division protein FtsW (lipid II flippase)
MTTFSSNESLDNYMNQVCKKFRPGKSQEAIRSELVSHMEEVLAEEQAAGFSMEEAASRAIARMGDPAALGKSLWRIHKPRVDIALLLPLLVLLGFGVLLACALPLALSSRFLGFPYKHILILIVGLAVAASMRLVNYRLLERYSGYLFAAALLFTLLPYWMNDRRYGGMLPYYDFGQLVLIPSHLAPYLLILALAGILSGEWWNKPGRTRKVTTQLYLFAAGCLIALPCFILQLQGNYASVLFYAVASFVLLVQVGTGWRRLALLYVPAIAIGISGMGDRMSHRMTGLLFYFREKDPLNADYQLAQSVKAIQEAGFWGHGYGVPLKSLPVIQSEMAFSYLTYSLGWIAALGLIAVLLFFFTRLFRVSKQIQHRYGRLLLTGLTTLFAFQVLWNLGMAVGLVPIMAIPLPFVSNGGTMLFFQLVMTGIMLSVTRRRYMPV